MYQKDYILRMIEMLAELIAAILGMIKKGKFPKATQAIENAYTDFLKEDAAFFRKLSKEDLTEKLLKEHNYTYGHLEILAELFYVEAELLHAQNKMEECLDYYEKSLLLHQFIVKEGQTFSVEKESKISKIQEKITKLTQ